MATVVTFRGRPDAAKIFPGDVPAEIQLDDGSWWVINGDAAAHSVGQSTQTAEYLPKR